MARVAIEVLSGQGAGRVAEVEGDAIRIGRALVNEIALGGACVSNAHARLVPGVDGLLVEDLESEGGTFLERGGARIRVTRATPLEQGDVLALGGEDEQAVRLRVRFEPDVEPDQIVELRPLGELGRAVGAPDDAAERLRALLGAQRALGAASDLDQVVTVLADAALELVPRATHATVALCEDDAAGRAGPIVTVVTRVREPGQKPGAPVGPVPATRSVARKVVRERAAVLAADAPSESFSSESLLGASIRSTIGVPLWKGDDILGVLQVDNRAAPAMFAARDVDALGVLAADASLAVANARLIARLEQAEQRLSRENQFLKGRDQARSSGSRIVGTSKAVTELLAQLDKVADTRVSVLVEGETGTGKELIAAALHYRSSRRDKLFVAQNCAAFPEQLLESELFGHKRGAFTGASEDKKGLFEVADGGTLFLDEIGEMPLSLQAKLLRVLQEGEIRPLGATQVKHVNVRIVAATNRKLEDEIKAGRFREDLYYRLKVFPLRVPPLRERREDVPALAACFLERYGKEIGKTVAGFAQETLLALASHGWPGNVRELENEVQRLVIQVEAGAYVTPELLSPSVRGATVALSPRNTAAAGTLKERVDQVERVIVLEVLKEHDNNKTSAARALGITREGLHKKMKLLGIG
jgi:transcriptional regulator with GAF, ATPase, and Fis domain